MKHPIQPLETDEHGTLRFKENKIVRYILDEGGIDMNHLAEKKFPKEDRVQFAQLIGYSLCGFGDLSYVSDEDYETADTMKAFKMNEKDARIEYLEEKLKNVKDDMREIVANLYDIHPDDLT